MMTRRNLLFGGLSALGAGVAAKFLTSSPQAGADEGTPGATKNAAFEISRSEEEWRRSLTPAQYRVLREHGTESPGSSPLNKEHRAGTYHCAGCDLPLFSSTTKFDSGTGWPSFWAPIENAIGTSEDRTLFFSVRTEVHCRRCGGHLGHVFEDGPPPTGLRYCMNGVSLRFVPA
jgi:peptide-methionine (R)-S-oxide reductase